MEPPELARLNDVIRWIDENMTAMPVQIPGRREMLAAGCFDVALEHQAAVAFLYASGLIGSMHAMLRPLIEATVRGLWLLLCASEHELDHFEKGRIEKPFGALAAEVEASIGAGTPVLTTMKRRVWSALHDFTHTGFRQVTRRHGDGRLGPSYPAADIARALDAAGAYGLVASALLAGMSGDADLIRRHIEAMKEYSEPT